MNDEAFQRAKEERLLLQILENRCHLRIGHIIKHNELVVNILEGAMPIKKSVGRPQLQYLKQVASNTGADSYTAMKRMACNKSRWEAANQSKDKIIRRRRQVQPWQQGTQCRLKVHFLYYIITLHHVQRLCRPEYKLYNRMTPRLGRMKELVITNF
jgi:hypothetical protein